MLFSVANKFHGILVPCPSLSCLPPMMKAARHAAPIIPQNCAESVPKEAKNIEETNYWT